MADIHPAAADGYTQKAGVYVCGRPDYPADVADWLKTELGLRTGKSVLDLGAGTGKFTARLMASGADVIAVEPVAAMRAELSRLNPGVDARAGTADAIPLAAASVDAVVCAQSFHWFATAAAVAEIFRVLKPGGMFGLIWNVRDETVDWVARLTDIMRPYEADVPRYHTGAWRRVLPSSGFGPLTENQYPNHHHGPAEQVIVDRVLSVSFIAALPESALREVAQRVRDLIAATPALAGRSEVTFPYQTMAFSCQKQA